MASKKVLQQQRFKVLNVSIYNSIQFFIIYVPSQQPNGQLQTQHNLMQVFTL
jgi:hypothetical protein